ncbi:MAG TPA: type II toxin-antitoxin system HicB family antitoxin [Bacteroidia bacterium]|nr:type II toxin-antitoxin system HicB family antitoxin [Bacteroidia bacterium]
MQRNYNIIIEKGLDGYLISSVVELPRCHTQAKSHDALMKRTKEAILLYLEVKKKFIPKNKFLGLQQVEV